jgi:hypothetical protein
MAANVGHGYLDHPPADACVKVGKIQLPSNQLRKQKVEDMEVL